MNIDDLDEVVTLRNHRRAALELRSRAIGGTIECNLLSGGHRHDVFSVLEATPIREAIRDACTAFVAEKDAALKALGVTVEVKEPF